MENQRTGVEDVIESLRKALLAQGARYDGIGHPFVWVDDENMLLGVYGILQWISCSSEEYQTPAAIRTPDHDEVLAIMKELNSGLIDFYFPGTGLRERFAREIDLASLVRTQDYCAVRTFCPQLPIGKVVQLDICPGYGSHAFYSLTKLGKSYIGLDASPLSYGTQRETFRFLSHRFGPYYDSVLAETLHETLHEAPVDISRQLAAFDQHAITHVPSWYCESLPDGSVDLVTATWVLNDVTPAGITWLLGQSARHACAKGGISTLEIAPSSNPEGTPSITTRLC